METEENRRPQPSGHEGAVCYKCRWVYPNPHPSAKQRRAHRKHCETTAGATVSTVESSARGGDEKAASDEELSDEDHHKNSVELVVEDLEIAIEVGEEVKVCVGSEGEGRNLGKNAILETNNMDSMPMSSLRSHRKVELRRGQPPAHLTIRNETRRIQKPARKPVIIYMVSPKIIHAEASEFMELVQRLTGLPAASTPCGESSAAHHQSSPGRRKFPVRVKARVLSHDPSPQSPIAPNPMHDSSPPSSLGIGARKEDSLATQSFPLRGDSSGQGPGLPPGSMLGSPNYQGIISQAEDLEHRWYKGVGELFFTG